MSNHVEFGAIVRIPKFRCEYRRASCVRGAVADSIALSKILRNSGEECEKLQLVVLRIQRPIFGNRCTIVVTGPRIWEAKPSPIRPWKGSWLESTKSCI